MKKKGWGQEIFRIKSPIRDKKFTINGNSFHIPSLEWPQVWKFPCTLLGLWQRWEFCFNWHCTIPFYETVNKWLEILPKCYSIRLIYLCQRSVWAKTPLCQAVGLRKYIVLPYCLALAGYPKMNRNLNIFFVIASIPS